METLTQSRLDQLTSPRRNHYFYGKLLDELHLTMEQQYVNGKRWMFNRLALGAGVLCGLQVSTDGKTLCVAGGVAIDGHGREIIVPQTVQIDPWQGAGGCDTVTALDPTKEPRVYLELCYCESKTDFMPALVTDCDTEDPCAPSTIVEGYRLTVRQVVKKEDKPPAVKMASEELCKVLNAGTDASDRRQRICEILSKESLTCAGPSGGACVTLATFTLLPGGKIADLDSVTPHSLLCSNELLFELLLCLQGGEGSVGPQGFQGLQGIQGPEGKVGPKGDTGLQGLQGTPGAPGLDGLNGMAGPKGDTGATGLQGLPGPQGIEGPPGPAGSGLTPNLTTITRINWHHDDRLNAMTVNQFMEGLRVTFSNAGVKPQNPNGDGSGWFLVAAEYDDVTAGTILVHRVLPQTPNGIGINTGTTEAFFKPNPAFLATFRNTSTKLGLKSVRVRVVVKCSFLNDSKDMAIDGDFFGRLKPLPSPSFGDKVETGDQVSGGDFESWFHLVL